MKSDELRRMLGADTDSPGTRLVRALRKGVEPDDKGHYRLSDSPLIREARPVRVASFRDIVRTRTVVSAGNVPEPDIFKPEPQTYPAPARSVVALPEIIPVTAGKVKLDIEEGTRNFGATFGYTAYGTSLGSFDSSFTAGTDTRLGRLGFAVTVHRDVLDDVEFPRYIDRLVRRAYVDRLAQAMIQGDGSTAAGVTQLKGLDFGHTGLNTATYASGNRVNALLAGLEAVWTDGRALENPAQLLIGPADLVQILGETPQLRAVLLPEFVDRIVISNYLDASTAYIGDFKEGVKMYVREGTPDEGGIQVTIAQSDQDFFLKGIVTIRVQIEGLFHVDVPQCLARVSGL